MYTTQGRKTAQPGESLLLFSQAAKQWGGSTSICGHVRKENNSPLPLPIAAYALDMTILPKAYG